MFIFKPINYIILTPTKSNEDSVWTCASAAQVLLPVGVLVIFRPSSGGKHLFLNGFWVPHKKIKTTHFIRFNLYILHEHTSPTLWSCFFVFLFIFESLCSSLRLMPTHFLCGSEVINMPYLEHLWIRQVDLIGETNAIKPGQLL